MLFQLLRLIADLELALPLILVMLAVGLLATLPRGTPPKTSSAFCPQPPEPHGCWPILGHLPLLASYGVNTWETLETISRIHGEIFSLQLGCRRCVVLSSARTFREVLITRAADFGGRPDFHRYNVLFGGTRENSLALCEWTPLQKLRRHLAQPHLLPRNGSSHSIRLQEVVNEELLVFFYMLGQNDDTTIPTKQLLLKMAANMFLKYLCSCRFSYSDQSFHDVVRNYDYLFYDMNQSYLVDFLPWSSFLHLRYFKSLSDAARDIRSFVENHVLSRWHENNDSHDIIHVLLQQLKNGGSKDFNYEAAMFELEDILGGSSGVANLCLRALGHVAQQEPIQDRIRAEVQAILHYDEGDERNCAVQLEDRHRMPFTEATMLETLRVTSSPIVPHVATTNTQIDGYSIEKGTIAIFNNYHLNFGEHLWEDPLKFNPDRFLGPSGGICKPDYFFPFSTGRRCCLGYKIVQNITFLLLANVCNNFTLKLTKNDESEFLKLRHGSLALPVDTFSVTFVKR